MFFAMSCRSCAGSPVVRSPLEPREASLVVVVDDDDEARLCPSAREEPVLKRRVETAELAFDDIPVGAVVRGAGERLVGGNRGT